MAEASPAAAIYSTSFNSGFVWRVELQGDALFDPELLRALRDAFREVGPQHAARMEHPPLALSFAELSDIFGRLWPGLVELNACTLPLRPLTLPSGATGYLHLSAWPALRAALEQRGIAADGPNLGAATAAGATPDRIARRRGPRLRFRMLFDPSLVGPSSQETDISQPPSTTAVELGQRVAGGVTMAGIDYERTDGSGVRGWTTALTDPAEAWDAGGQPPVWIVHRKHHRFQREFAGTLMIAVAEAARALRVPQPEAVLADLGVATCEEAAVVRIGPQAGALVRAGVYRQFVQQLAAALGRCGVPAAAVLEPRHLNPLALEDLVPDAAPFVVSPDPDASMMRLVELRQDSAHRQDADAVEAECRRLRIAAWGELKPPVVAWLPEPSSPLFGRTPRPVMHPQLAIYVTSDAVLPPHGAEHAEAWLDLVLNGGKHGLDRAINEVSGSRRIGAIAVARALSARQLKRPLPMSRRTNLDSFRLACGRHLAGFARTSTEPALARAVGEILLASVRQPRVATELVATAQDLLMSRGTRLPLIVVFGARGTTLLRVSSADPISVDFAMSLVVGGYEEDLAAIWLDNPRGIIRPAHLDRVIPELLDSAAVGTDSAALAAFGRWAMQDAGNRRLRGVRGLTAYVTVPEARLSARGIERVYFLRETTSHVIVMCTSSSSQGEGEGRTLMRLPRTGEDWDRWAASPGGALLAGFLAGAYRDMVVPLDVEPFVEHTSAPSSADATSPVRLEPVGYLPARRRPRRRGAAGLVDRLRPTPHQVTWYIRRLASGQRARPEALARAAAVGMTVPPGYTFVDTYFWPRATDPRSAATALRATVAVSSLRALLQTAAMQVPKPVADEVGRGNGSSHRSAGANGSAHSEPAPSQTTTLPSPTAPRPWWAFWRRG